MGGSAGIVVVSVVRRGFHRGLRVARLDANLPVCPRVSGRRVTVGREQASRPTRCIIRAIETGKSSSVCSLLGAQAAHIMSAFSSTMQITGSSNDTSKPVNYFMAAFLDVCGRLQTGVRIIMLRRAGASRPSAWGSGPGSPGRGYCRRWSGCYQQTAIRVDGKPFLAASYLVAGSVAADGRVGSLVGRVRHASERWTGLTAGAFDIDQEGDVAGVGKQKLAHEAPNAPIHRLLGGMSVGGIGQAPTQRAIWQIALRTCGRCSSCLRSRLGDFGSNGLIDSYWAWGKPDGYRATLWAISEIRLRLFRRHIPA